MSRKYFGTDGIRGMANSGSMTASVALTVGMAAGLQFAGATGARRAVIGKDTRRSCYMLENALAAGFVSVGMDVVLLGPIPTPGVATLTRSLRADLGVMISASHNPYHDNGIKLFGPDGYKLSDDTEHAIEARMDSDLSDRLAPSGRLGRVSRLEGAIGRYSEFCKSAFPKHLRLNGLRIVLDAANGAAYRVAPEALWELGAEVIPLGVEPDGYNINKDCGSTVPQVMQRAVREYRADIGIALDGDADRVMIADERGELIDGDQIMALVAGWLHKRGELKGGGVVGTVMSNLGLERYLEGLGLTLQRTQVGDRYVVECMREKGFNMGGEQSGHVVFADHSTTGDGLIAALQVLACRVEAGRPMSELAHQFTQVPQLMKNVRFGGGKPLESEKVQEALKSAEEKLGRDGRLVVRKSGTEPVIRIMAEHADSRLVAAIVGELEDTIRQAAG